DSFYPILGSPCLLFSLAAGDGVFKEGKEEGNEVKSEAPSQLIERDSRGLEEPHLPERDNAWMKWNRI
ncbi:hypothetical protein RW092_10445, partial [Paenibacillus sp. 3LSP]|uniref:hypothetical protein n=1 Tax=Paenibacillus sp. 3LSP TaxID=2800795 RepID=UPI0028FD054F